MRSIIWNLTATLFCMMDAMHFAEGYSAKPVIRRTISISPSASIKEGRRFVLQSTAVQSSASSLPFDETVDDFVLGKPFSGLIGDFNRRKPHYKSDWTDGFRKKSLAAVLFLYFACLGDFVDVLFYGMCIRIL